VVARVADGTGRARAHALALVERHFQLRAHRADLHLGSALLAHSRPQLLAQRRHLPHELRVAGGAAEMQRLELLAARRDRAPLLHLHRRELLQPLLRAHELLHALLRVAQQPRLLGEAGPRERERLDQLRVLRALLGR